MNDKRKKLAGIILLLLYIGISLFSIGGIIVSLSSFELPEERDLLVENLEMAKGFEFPDGLDVLALREMKFLSIFYAVTIPFYLSPLLIIGLRFVTGLDHILWSWQKNRQKRHPIIAYLFFIGSIYASYRFFQRMLNPMNKAQMAVFQGGTEGEIVYLITMLICIAASLWFYIGKKNPIVGGTEKTEN